MAASTAPLLLRPTPGPDLDVGCSSNPDTVLPRLHRLPYPETRPLCDPTTSLSAHAQKQQFGGQCQA